MRSIFFLVAAILLGLTGGYAWSQWSKPSAAQKATAQAQAIPSAKPGQTKAEIEETAYYADLRGATRLPEGAGPRRRRNGLHPDILIRGFREHVARTRHMVERQRYGEARRRDQQDARRRSFGPRRLPRGGERRRLRLLGSDRRFHANPITGWRSPAG